MISDDTRWAAVGYDQYGASSRRAPVAVFTCSGAPMSTSNSFPPGERQLFTLYRARAKFRASPLYTLCSSKSCAGLPRNGLPQQHRACDQFLLALGAPIREGGRNALLGSGSNKLTLGERKQSNTGWVVALSRGNTHLLQGEA